jgi:transposase
MSTPRTTSCWTKSGRFRPLLPHMPPGVPPANDCKVLKSSDRSVRTGSPWAHIPKLYGSAMSCGDHFRAGQIWAREIAS